MDLILFGGHTMIVFAIILFFSSSLIIDLFKISYILDLILHEEKFLNFKIHLIQVSDTFSL